MTISAQHQREQVVALVKQHFVIGFRNRMIFYDLLFPVVFLFLNIYSDMNEGIWRIVMGFSSLVFITIQGNFIYYFVEQKQNKVSESYQIMGLTQAAYDRAWYSIQFLKVLTVAVVFILVGLPQDQYVISVGGQAQTFGLFFFFSIALLFQGFFYSLFFSNSIIATVIYTLLYIISSALHLIAGRKSDSDGLNIILSLILPQFGVALGMNQRKDWSESYTTAHHIKPHFYMILLIGSAIIYAILYGIVKHCLSRKNIQSGQNQDQISSVSENNDFSSAELCQKFQNNENLNQTICLNKVQKQFGNSTALDLSLCCYESQIFCLLGHTQSGKSTVLNVITGALVPEKGNVRILNRNMKENQAVIRQNIGYSNSELKILFNHYTVQEHLELMAHIKGIPEENQAGSVQQIIEQCMLENEKKQILSTPKPGKLSKIIYSYGFNRWVLNDNSRLTHKRTLRKLKISDMEAINRFATNDLEEAEHLSDRMGILSEGKLKAVGSIEFVKEKFGCGYLMGVQFVENQQKNNFSLPKTSQTSNKITVLKQQITNKIDYIIDGAKKVEENETNMQFSLPPGQKPKFKDLITELTKIEGIKISFSVNSLQDTFYNIAKNEQEKRDQLVLNMIQNKKKEKSNSNSVESSPTYPQNSQTALVDQQDGIQENRSIVKPKISFCSQFKSILMKKLKLTYRSKAWLLGILISIGIYIAGVFFIGAEKYKTVDYTFDATKDYPKKKLRMDLDPQLPQFENQAKLVSTFISIGLSFSMTYFALPVVEEKERKLKYLQNIMGLQSVPYWLANFCIDYIVMLVQIVVFIIAGSTADNTDLIKEPVASWFFVLIPGFAACLLYSYILSFAYKKVSHVYKYLFWILILFQYGIPTLLLFPIKSSQNENKFAIMQTIWYLFVPVFGVNQSALCVINQFKNDLVSNPIMYRYPDNAAQETAIFKPLSQFPDFKGGLQEPYQFFILFLVQIPLYFFITVVLDKYSSQIKEQSYKQELGYDSTHISQEAQEEKRKIIENKDNITLRAINIGKKYENGKTGVKSITLGVKEGQTIVVAGPNNSGKSTLFNILSGLIPPTSGQIYLKRDQKLDSQMGYMLSHIGVCPSYNILWDLLTVQEHLELFGKIKGLRDNDLPSQVSYYIDQLNLKKNANQKIQYLSDSNKKILCQAITFVGNPQVLMFDSPTEGLDNQAKLNFQKCLQSGLLSHNKSVFITTSNISEAEALGDKVGILTNGQMLQYGQVKLLQEKFAKGFTILLSTQRKEYTKVTGMIQKVFPTAAIEDKIAPQDVFKTPIEKYKYQDEESILLDIQQKDKERVKLMVSIRDDNFDYTAAFFFFDQLKDIGAVSEFSIKNSSLQDNYKAICSQQQSRISQSLKL